MKKFDLIMLAAGSGSRFKHEEPKQFFKLNNVPVFIRTLNVVINEKWINKILLTINVEFRNKYIELLDEYKISRDKIHFVDGGNHRLDSIKNTFPYIETDHVIVMEAARPFASTDTYNKVIMNPKDNVISVMESAQTPYIIEGDKLVSVINTKNMALSTTPKKYLSSDLREVLEVIDYSKNDEAEFFLSKKLGYEFCDSINIKITNPIDRFIAENILKEKEQKK